MCHGTTPKHIVIGLVNDYQLKLNGNMRVVLEEKIGYIHGGINGNQIINSEPILGLAFSLKR